MVKEPRKTPKIKVQQCPVVLCAIFWMKVGSVKEDDPGRVTQIEIKRTDKAKAFWSHYFFEKHSIVTVKHGGGSGILLLSLCCIWHTVSMSESVQGHSKIRLSGWSAQCQRALSQSQLMASSSRIMDTKGSKYYWPCHFHLLYCLNMFHWKGIVDTN